MIRQSRNRSYTHTASFERGIRKRKAFVIFFTHSNTAAKACVTYRIDYHCYQNILPSSTIIQVWNKTGSGVPTAQVCHLSVRPIPAVPVLLFGLGLPRTGFLPRGPWQVYKGLLSAILDRSWWYRGRLRDRQRRSHRLYNWSGPGTTKSCQRNVYVGRSVDQRRHYRAAWHIHSVDTDIEVIHILAFDFRRHRLPNKTRWSQKSWSIDPRRNAASDVYIQKLNKSFHRFSTSWVVLIELLRRNIFISIMISRSVSCPI